MTETREPAETGGYASLEEDDEDLSPGPEHSSDSEYTLSEPDSEEEDEEEEEEEETTDDPEYDPGYKDYDQSIFQNPMLLSWKLRI